VLGLDNPIHLLFLLGILLLVFGAKRLPEIGSSLGAGLRGFKDSIAGDAGHGELNQMTAPVAPQAAEPVAQQTAPPVAQQVAAAEPVGR
jgi:sec-independent protein translocase protein TatA